MRQMCWCAIDARRNRACAPSQEMTDAGRAVSRGIAHHCGRAPTSATTRAATHLPCTDSATVRASCEAPFSTSAAAVSTQACGIHTNALRGEPVSGDAAARVCASGLSGLTRSCSNSSSEPHRLKRRACSGCSRSGRIPGSGLIGAAKFACRIVCMTVVSFAHVAPVRSTFSGAGAPGLTENGAALLFNLRAH